MTTSLAHFDLAAIKPSNGPQFSPNLYRWVRKQPEFIRDRLTVYRGKIDISAKKSDGLYIGRMDEDGWFIGTRLYSVLCFGGRKESYAYMPKHVRGLRLTEIKDLWKRYAAIGRCAVDQGHTGYFQGDETRWKVKGNIRHCLWCNQVSQRRETWTETHVEKHERWIIQ